MEKVILDTNILYSLVGISPNIKVKPDLGMNYELWTTSAVLIEGIVKHRTDLEAIKQFLKPIIEEEIKLISIGHAPLTTYNIKELYNASSIETVSRLINKIFDLKIGKEAEFLRLIFVMVVLGIFVALIETEGYGFKDDIKSRMQTQLIRALIEGNEQLSLEYFQDRIKQGYIAENEQLVVLDAFNEMLFTYINIFHFNYYQIDSGVINNGEISVENSSLANLTQKLSGDQFYQKISRHLENPFGLIAKKSLHSHIDSYLQQIKDGFAGEPNLTQHAIEFLKRKLEKGFKEKAKIRKNDIFDFLQVFALELQGYKILTLDKVFIGMLQSVDYASWNLINGLGYDK